MISVVVCTFNRSELVGECIASLLQQSVKKELYEIIIVDNASTDDTADKVKGLILQHDTIKYVYEENIGLSHARNAGYKAARFDWVNYIDDDALAHNDYIEQICWTIENYDWDCFGGVFNRWFKYGQPKWYPLHFGTNRYDFDKIDLLPDEKYACGGVLTIRRSILEKLAGFKSEYGMSGTTIGYGEETELQNRLRAQNYTIGFNPQIQIDHLVARYKLSIWWHIRAAWVSEAVIATMTGKKRYPFFATWKIILKITIKRLRYLSKLRQPEYYWQNFLFDYLEPIVRRISAVYTLYFKS